MNYMEMVQNAPKKSEEIMWQSVQSISELIDDLWGLHANIARKFMMKEYARMYGEHFNRELAEDTVDEMYHKSNGQMVEGEMVSADEAMSIAPSEEYKWDAYVGANAMMHDLANTGFGKSDVMKAARQFWFSDEDFDGKNKVFWYFANK